MRAVAQNPWAVIAPDPQSSAHGERCQSHERAYLLAAAVGEIADQLIIRESEGEGNRFGSALLVISEAMTQLGADLEKGGVR